MAKNIKIALFLVGILIFIILISKIPLKDSWGAVTRANLLITAIGAFFYIIVISLRSLKWLLLTKEIKPNVKYKEIAPIYLVNSLMGNITPFKSGELTSVFLFKKYLKMSKMQGLAILIFDRFFEIIIFSLILIASFLYIITHEIKDGAILVSFQKIFLIATLLIVVLMIIIFFKKPVIKMFNFFEFIKNNSTGKKIFVFLENKIDAFYSSFSLFKNKKILFLMFLLTSLAWLSEIISFYLVFTSVYNAPFLQITSAQIISLGASLIAFIPAGVGISELSTVFIMGLFGHPSSLVFGGTILSRIILTGILFGSGLIGLTLVKEKE